MPGKSADERASEWARHGKWLQVRVKKARLSGLLRQEPTSDVSAYVDALFTDEDFDQFNDPGRAGVISRLARAHQLRESLEARWPLASVAESPQPKRKRRGPRVMPTLYDSFGPDVRSLDGMLWPFAAFFAQASAALERGESLSEQPWPARVEEISYVLLLTRPGDEGRKILFELARRAGVPRGREFSREESENARAAVVDQWIGRKRAIDAYIPRARTMAEAAVRACQYVVAAMQRQGKREVGRSRFTQSPQTIRRYQNEGHRITSQEDADRVSNAKVARMKHVQTGTLSESQVAERLRCSRGVVQRAREKAVATGTLRDVPVVDNARRYRVSDVREIARIVKKRTRRK